MTQIMDYLTNSIEKRLTAIALFINISKAFDCLSHLILLSKLEFYGLRGTTLELFKSYLTDRFHFTEVNGNKFLFSFIKNSAFQEIILRPYLCREKLFMVLK